MTRWDPPRSLWGLLLLSLLAEGILTALLSSQPNHQAATLAGSPGSSISGPTVTPAIRPSPTGPAATSQLVARTIEQFAADTGTDEYSRSPANWKPILDRFGAAIGAHLLGDPSGGVHVLSSGSGYLVESSLGATGTGSGHALRLVAARGIRLPVQDAAVYAMSPGFGDNDARDAAASGSPPFDNPGVPTGAVARVCRAGPVHHTGSSPGAPWTAQHITAQFAATTFGRDNWSRQSAHWHPAGDGYGWALDAEPDGSYSLVEMVDAIGEGYWEVPVPGTSPQIGVTLGVGVELPVKAATVYYGVPDGLEVDALEAATRQLIEGPTAIEGVYVLEICGPTEA